MRRFTQTCLYVVVLSILSMRVDAAVITSTPEPSNEWQVAVAAYLWGAGMNGTTANGDSFSVPFRTIIENLDMGFMGLMDIRKDKFSFTIDALYLSVSADKSQTVSLPVENDIVDVDVMTSVKQSSWIVTPTAGYRVIDASVGSLDLVGGARYLFIKPSITITTTGPSTTQSVSVSGSGDVWDGIVGIKSRLNISENWYLPIYADIGAGDSEYTRQALGGIAYHFSKADVILAYRYMDWRFHTNPLLNKLDLSGPLLGARFVF